MEKRKKIVAGNWKMNLGFDEAVELVKNIVQEARDEKVTKIICPPFPYLKTLRELLVDEDGFFVGAQNCSEHEKGAFTGEVSARMLRDCGSRYVIIGHSERRTFFYETDGQLEAKIAQAVSNHLSVIFCFGELLQDRRAGKQREVVSAQLRGALASFPKNKLHHLVLAYEPVWAIGTGETATPEQAQEMHEFVRAELASLFGSTAAAQTSILYGGSCNPGNARQLFACPDVDGGLIGGASLKATDFCQIIRSF